MHLIKSARFRAKAKLEGEAYRDMASPKREVAAGIVPFWQVSMALSLLFVSER